MYARLCQRLSTEVPNFETPPEPCTFLILLLNKCRDEFENRSKANEAFDLQDGPLGPDDEERQQNAKRKMLGNIKFIGELGKLEILGESILHLCIRQLLQEKSKRNREARSCDVTEDLELLCQIMRTCGRNLDVKGKNLMDQYFQRMTNHAENLKLSTRIRFMLRDVIELRMCGWIPREATNAEGPKPMHQIQTDDPRGSSKGNQKHMGFNGNNNGFPVGSYNRRGPMDSNMGNYKNNSQNGDFNYVPQRQYQDQNFRAGNKQQNYQPQRKTGQQYYNNLNMNSLPELNSNKPGYKKDLPPNFTDKMKFAQQHSNLNPDNISLRPPPQSMFRPNTTKPTLGGGLGQQNHQRKPMESLSQQIFKEPPSLVKQGSFDKPKIIKKEKIVVKEETVESLMEAFNCDDKLSDMMQKIPDKLVKSFLQAVMLKALDKNDVDREKVCALLTEVMKKPNHMNASQFLEVYQNLLSHIEEKEDTTFHSYLAKYAAHAICEGFVPLAKVADVAGNGAHLPLFLILQELHKTLGELKLAHVFNESKVNLMKLLPEAERNKERLLKVLEDRNLGFLLPLLGIQSELWKQMQVDSNPTVFYKWVKENIDVAHQTKPEFIGALMTVILKHIIAESAQKPQAMESLSLDDKSAMDKELALLGKFKGVLQAFLNEQVNLQVTALYALQTLCYALDFPKGLMLRWFVNLYQLEVIEEDAFLKWKEDVTDEYPGKGKALFQVNQWLVWLESAESEPEDDD